MGKKGADRSCRVGQCTDPFDTPSAEMKEWYAGRLQLIQSVQLPMTQFWCLVSIWPKKVISGANEMFYCGKDSKTTGAKVDRDSVC